MTARRAGMVIAAVVAALSLVAGGAAATGRPFATDLTGAAEVPGPGDPDGSGTMALRLNQGQARVCWEADATNIDVPTIAHIHIGDEATAGPIVLTLWGMPLNADPTTTPAGVSEFPASACVENVDTDLIKAIRQNPDDYYVNIHNDPFPAGAIRGQLSK
jgi:hypothetical protein